LVGDAVCIVNKVSWTEDEIREIHSWLTDNTYPGAWALYELGAKMPDRTYSFQDVVARLREQGDQRGGFEIGRDIARYSSWMGHHFNGKGRV
jgi:hypothetical protein